jgi:hypothetical protein
MHSCIKKNQRFQVLRQLLFHISVICLPSWETRISLAKFVNIRSNRMITVAYKNKQRKDRFFIRELQHVIP